MLHPFHVIELIESTMYLYQATKDPFLLEVGIDILESIEHSAKTKCGYASVSHNLVVFSHKRAEKNLTLDITITH